MRYFIETSPTNGKFRGVLLLNSKIITTKWTIDKAHALLEIIEKLMGFINE